MHRMADRSNYEIEIMHKEMASRRPSSRCSAGRFSMFFFESVIYIRLARNAYLYVGARCAINVVCAKR